MSETAKHVMDGASIAATISTVVGWLPQIAAIFSIIWVIIRVYDRFSGGRKPTPECAQSCPLIARSGED